MKRLAYIVLMTLLIAANAAAGENYVIDIVCQGAERTYRINGEETSTWEWKLLDADSTEITLTNPTGTDFADMNTYGDSIWGSEITIVWPEDTTGTFYLSVEQTSNYVSVVDGETYMNCTNHELGEVEVIEGPEAFAGEDIIACTDENIFLEAASASNHSTVIWTTFSEGVKGTFSNENVLHPTYFPSDEDIAAGSVTLSLTAFGKGNPGTCEMDVSTVTITFSNPVIELTATNPVCFDENSGSISTNVSGGFGTYTYAWTGPGDFTADTEEITGLAAGWYYLAVTDSVGCVAEDSVEIIEPEKLLTTIDSVEHVNCFNGIDGAARVAVSGGTGNYTYSWNTVPEQTTALATGLAAGEYLITVTDENGCEVKDSVEITEPPALVLSADSVDASCGGKQPGSIDLTVSGGTPFADGYYLYKWHDDTGFIADTEDIVDLEGEKLYWVYVTDSLGCTDSLEMFINEEKNIELTASVSPILCYGDSGTLYIEVRHGQKPYSYVWLNSLNDTIRVENTDNKADSVIVPAGEYRVVVNDNKGCDEDESFLLESPDELTTSISPDPAEICEDETLPLNGNPVGGIGSYTHLWSGEGATYLSNLAVVDPEFSGAPAGSYELIYAVTDENGCETRDTINIGVFPQYSDTLDMAICESELPYNWNGTNIDLAGIYSDTLASVAGCDSIITLSLDVLPDFRDTTFATICESELPYNWNGTNIDLAGTYSDTLASVAGCDSILVLNLDVLPEFRDTTFATVCESELPYIWNGTNIDLAGIYSDTLASVAGCDSILTLVLDVLPEFRDTVDVTICDSELPYFWNGADFFGAGIYSDTLASVAGCDSILTLDLKVVPEYRDTIPMVICENEVPFDWYGQQITISGFYEHTLTSVAGCDSILTLVLDVLPEFRDTTNAVVCESELPYNWNGTNIDLAGTYSDTLASVAGCDSILTLILDVLPEFRDTTNAVVCASELPYFWNGTNVDLAGTYSDTLTSVVGCDSILTLVLDVLPEFRDTTNAVVCESELPYFWNGTNIDLAGTYSDTLASVAGCDSILTLILDVLPEFRDTTNAVVCASELPYFWNGTNVDLAGTYSDTLASVAGCDSILTLILDVLPEFRDTTFATVCESALPYNWNGTNIDLAGTYSDTLASVAGCDSILTLILDVLPEFRDTTNAVVCESELPYFWNGTNIDFAGTYSDTLASVAGCDSILTLILDVLPEFRDTTNAVVCASELPYFWNGTNVDLAGTYSDTLASVAGCDSILTLILDVLPEFRDTTNAVVCASELPYFWNGTNIDFAGTYSDTLALVAGCDSILTLVLDVLPEFRDTVDVTICDSELPYNWNGTDFFDAGIYSDTLASAAGCDSILTLDLKVVPEYRDTIPMVVCEGEVPFDWYGQQIATSGFYEHTLNSVAGCDSVLTLNLEIVPEYHDTIPMSVCETEVPFDWYGQQITGSGFYEHIFTSVSGCDSVLTLELETEPEIPVTITIAADQTEITEGEQVTLTATPENGGSDPVYAWFVNGAEVPGETAVTYTYTPQDGDEIYAMLTSGLDCAAPVPAISNTVVLTVVQPSEITITPDITHVDCFGNSTGAIELTVSNGVEPYSYAWSNGEATKNIYGLEAGIYTVTVTDAEGTEETLTIEITEPDALELTFTKTDVGDSPDPTGSISLNVEGGTGPYSYEWVGPNGFTSADEDISNLEAGNYTVFVTDANNCTEFLSVVIAGYGMTCPPVIVIDCGLDEMPEPYATLAEYEAAGGVIESTYALIEESFTQMGTDVSDGESCPETITRTYSIENTNGDVISCEQLIIIRDVTAPILEFSRKRVNCPGEKPPVYRNRSEFEAQSGNLASDECELDWSSFRYSGESTDAQKCPETIIRFYEIKDMCGNTTQAREIIVIEDKLDPYVYRPARDIITDCTVPEPYRNYTEFWEDGGLVEDNCNIFTLEHIGDSEPTGDGCPMTITRTYRFTDNCGNSTDFEQKITVNDTIPPNITCPPDVAFDAGAGELEALTGLAYSDSAQQVSLTDTTALDIGASDNCEVVTITYQDEIAGSCPATVTRTFTIYDGCGNTASCTQTIELYREDTPLFEALGPFCQNSEPEALPSTSSNDITGTWEPAVIRTDSTGMFTYTFTPDPGQCAVDTTVEIEILEIITPDLAPIGPICQYTEPPALPDTDVNGIPGTWDKDTIDTSIPGEFTFTFTPSGIGDCTEPASITIQIDTVIIPQFAPIGPLCQNEEAPTLPEANFNGTTGTWIPDEIRTDSVGVFDYVFVPDTGYNCAFTDTLQIEVKPWIQPEFDPIGPLCVGEIPLALPDSSINGLYGTWNLYGIPTDTIPTDEAGLFLFQFIPDERYNCINPRNLAVTIIENTPPVAENDSVFTLQEEQVMIDILENDYDTNTDGEIDITSATLLQVPAHGTAEINPATGIVSYTPEFGYFGMDTLYYSVCDNGIPCDVQCDSARVIIEIGEPNNPPVAVIDSFSVMCFPLTGDLLYNDFDPDNDELTMSLWPVEEPEHGIVDLHPDGTFVYMPDEGYMGPDSFIYRVCDNGIPVMCDETQVWIYVLPDADCDGVPDYEEDVDTECTLMIPEGFSPNGDGVHDFFQIYCIDKYPDAVMRIFDRAGNKLFEKQHYGNLNYWGSNQEAWWWGKTQNKWVLGRGNLPAGNYLYVLELGNGEVRTGTVMIAY
ncbi:gliding motility-associated C-terminal domain-containing protein [Tangfeifania diversioriginum]|uniref:Gliding motility-associated C-terminal domain-containing protein n=1 Tax=Tangfeifania diversioriginum TaxID=1168035 RepID=A0A1M6HHA5_9BACT|nr:Ig-like domain-containing protein [Tangfeifania diversioriginum]SHJ21583.1 gliding motility-associated C-terminal domain-containing protein [Tangfeifania diversioriginum]